MLMAEEKALRSQVSYTVLKCVLAVLTTISDLDIVYERLGDGRKTKQMKLYQNETGD